jgi:hypothetical protein
MNSAIHKLGRIRPVSTHRIGKMKVIVRQGGNVAVVPSLGAFLAARSPSFVPPLTTDWRTKAAPSIARMYLNDQYGDCVIAGKYHAIGVWTGNEDAAISLATDDEVLASYQTICGAGDNGCEITSVLDYWKNKGLIVAGQKHVIDAYVDVDNSNADLVKTAISIFGGLTLGIDLPNAWTVAPGTWDVTATSVVGGHDVRAIDYNDVGVIIATWGELCTITWAAFTSPKWITECYCELSPDWYDDANIAPSGIDLPGLKSALALL